jgi:PAS domain S-box-containing protein
MENAFNFADNEFGHVLVERVLPQPGETAANGILGNDARCIDGAAKVVPIAAAQRAQEAPRPGDMPPRPARDFCQLLDALPAAIYTTDAGGRITYYNDAAAELWGQRPVLGADEWCGAWKLFRPDGTPLPHDECALAVALKEDRRVRDFEAACERPDGSRVPFIAHPTPLHDESGRLTGAINMLVDLSECKQAEEQQALMVRELHHRVKNTLATVQAIMGSTARSAETIDDFKTALIGRIGSLAKTHLLLCDEGRSEVLFEQILRNELDAFDDGSGSRVRFDGPPVEVSSRLAVSLGMTIHELTTNAAKYGALSVYGGKVDIGWRVTEESARRILHFDWVESGGPPVPAPTRQGFGSRLMAYVLPGQIQAKTAIEFVPDGVRVHCSLPLPPETKI